MVVSRAGVGVPSILVASIDASLREGRFGASVLRVAFVLVLALEVFVVVVAWAWVSFGEWGVRLRTLPC